MLTREDYADEMVNNGALLTNGTPVDIYKVDGHDVLVKREDLCCPEPGPSFSKLRGVVAHIARRPEPVIGVLDTYHSKAGWAVAYTCRALGKRCYNYWPRYTADPDGVLRSQQEVARGMGAELVALKAGRSAILYHAAKAHLKEHYGSHGAYMMPNALKLPESVIENGAEFDRTYQSGALPEQGTLVISISSGTVAAGVVRALAMHRDLDYDVVFHMGYSRSADAVRDYISEMSGVQWQRSWRIIDQGYNYADAAKNIVAPFPANPFYDLKAWKWLTEPGVLDDLSVRGPVVFWNIGA